MGVLLILPGLGADEVVVPQLPRYNVTQPPLLGDLLIDQYAQQINQERAATKEIVSQVVQGSKEECETLAQELAINQKKLREFLDNLPAEIKARKQEESCDLPSKLERVALLDDELSGQYNHPLLRAHTVTLAVSDVSISDFIALLSSMAPLNFVLDSAASGSVKTAYFQDISVGDALRNILPNVGDGLALVHAHNAFHILPLDQAQKKVNVMLKAGIAASMRTIVIQLQHASLSESHKLRIEAMWQHICKKKGAGSGAYLIFDDESRQIFVRGTMQQLRAFNAYIKMIDVKRLQVKIEARVVMVCSDFEESYGLQWSNLFNRRACIDGGFEVVGSGPLEDIQNQPKPQTCAGLTDWVLNLFPPAATVCRTLHLPLVFGGSDLETKRLNIVLNAAEAKGDLKTILKPSLLVANNEEAEMLVGNRVPIETIIKENIEGSLRDITTATYIDVGTKLKVKPTISSDATSIFLDIYVENSCLKGCSGKFPIIRTTRAHNRVVLQSGQTTLIGGLIEQDRTKERTLVPILGDIPVLGLLFQGLRRMKREAQLLIFLTPTMAS